MTTSNDRTTPARGRRRARGRRAVPRGTRGPIRKALVTALAVAVLGTAGLGWVYLRLSGAIDTFDGDGLSKNRPVADSSGATNVLVIGSDARTDGNSALGGGSADDVGRSDTAFLLHVYADHEHAVAVSVPRDTLVTIPPCRLPDGTWTTTRTDAMFNAAFSVGQTAEGNPACTQNTVEELTGLRVDHTVVVDFKGFAALTEVVGGVRVCLPADVYQKDLNPHRATRGELLFHEGEQDVSGQAALDYVRLRHGIGDSSDIGRIKRQQAFVAALVKKVRSDGLTPTRLLPLADAAVESMTVDPGLGTAGKLVSFVMSLRDVDLHHMKFVTVPWRYEGARVAVVQPDADRLWAALAADRTLDGTDAAGGTGSGTSPSPSPSPSDGEAVEEVDGEGIAVTVHNGTTTSGLASRAASALTAHGLTVTGTANADSQDRTTTVIRYGTGLEARARTVAALFPGATLEPGADAAIIDVILGRDYSGAGAGASASPAPTSVPSSVADGARSADDDPCSDLSYG
ncbi:LCP family protein [Streptomyces sp. CRN 30]|uniref:LCP family protein n=1 Tax=Streptomyces sp. CRN 30 TaxID=3075613 RepID=UPI002A82A9C8|nr:LCP family protein [Streptomyces sp. CRN 30]